jgi:hypothetical protein
MIDVTYLFIEGYTNIPHPTPLRDKPKAIFFLMSKYSLTISTAGIKVMPKPHPIIKEKVANKYSILVARELKQKPRVPIREPAIITRRCP